MEIAVGVGVFAGTVGKDLVVKLLGPTAEYLGQELQGWTQRRIENTSKIFANAEAKLGNRINEPGRVPPKVLKEILDDGSFAEDELTADYFGGVLASSRTGVDRDDRGATLAKLVAQLSVYELRSHYLIYSEIKRLFDGDECELGTRRGRDRLRLYISADAFESALELTPGENFETILQHVTHGLLRNDLVDMYLYAGEPETLKDAFANAPSNGLVVEPSSFGAELFLWAQGLGQVPPSRFLDPDVKLLSNISLPIKGPVLSVHAADSQPMEKSDL